MNTPKEIFVGKDRNGRVLVERESVPGTERYVLGTEYDVLKQRYDDMRETRDLYKRCLNALEKSGE